MIKDDTRQRIDAMTIEEMAYEISRGHRSRFQRDNFDYLKSCYEMRLRNINTVLNATANPTNTEPPNIKKLKSISLTSIVESVIAGLVVVFITYLLWKHFGIQLYGG